MIGSSTTCQLKKENTESPNIGLAAINVLNVALRRHIDGRAHTYVLKLSSK